MRIARIRVLACPLPIPISAAEPRRSMGPGRQVKPLASREESRGHTVRIPRRSACSSDNGSWAGAASWNCIDARFDDTKAAGWINRCRAEAAFAQQAAVFLSGALETARATKHIQAAHPVCFVLVFDRLRLRHYSFHP